MAIGNQITAQRKLELLGKVQGMAPDSFARAGGAQELFRGTGATEQEIKSLGNVQFAKLAEGFRSARSGQGAVQGGRIRQTKSENLQAFQSFLGTDPSLQQSFDTGLAESTRIEDINNRFANATRGLDKQFQRAKGMHFTPTVTVGGIEVSNDAQGLSKLRMEKARQALGSDFAEFQQMQSQQNQGSIDGFRTKISNIEQKISSIESGLSGRSLKQRERDNKQINSERRKINRFKTEINNLTLGLADENTFASGVQGQQEAAKNLRSDIERRSRNGGDTGDAKDRRLDIINLQEQFSTGATAAERAAAGAELNTINKQRMASGDIGGGGSGSGSGPVTASSVTGGIIDTPQPDRFIQRTEDPTQLFNQLRGQGLGEGVIQARLRREGFSPDQISQAAGGSNVTPFQPGPGLPGQPGPGGAPSGGSVSGVVGSGQTGSGAGGIGGGSIAGVGATGTGSTFEGGDVAAIINQSGISDPSIISSLETQGNLFNEGTRTLISNLTAANQASGTQRDELLSQTLSSLDGVINNLYLPQIQQQQDIRNEMLRSIEASQSTEQDAENLAADRTRRELQFAADESRQLNQENISSKAASNRMDVVRRETFLGLRGGFGSGAGLENLERAADADNSALASLRQVAARSSSDFASKLNEASREHVINLRSINDSADGKKAANNREFTNQTNAIVNNVAMTEKQKIEALNRITENKIGADTALAETIAEAVQSNTINLANIIGQGVQDEYRRGQDSISNSIAFANLDLARQKFAADQAAGDASSAATTQKQEERAAKITEVTAAIDNLVRLQAALPDKFKGSFDGRTAEWLEKAERNSDLQEFQSQKNIVGQQLARLFEGGRMSDDDRKFYQAQIPNIRQGGPSAVAAAKSIKAVLTGDFPDLFDPNELPGSDLTPEQQALIDAEFN